MKEKQDSLLVRLLASIIDNSSVNGKKNVSTLGCAWAYSPSFIIRTEKTFV